MLVLVEADKKAPLGNDFIDCQAIEMKSRCHCILGKLGVKSGWPFGSFEGNQCRYQEGLEVCLQVLEQWQHSDKLPFYDLARGCHHQPVFHNPWRWGRFSVKTGRWAIHQEVAQEIWADTLREFLASFKFWNFKSNGFVPTTRISSQISKPTEILESRSIRYGRALVCFISSNSLP